MSYAFRLACLSLAVFFLVNLCTGVIAALVAPRAIRAAEKMRAQAAARFLLMLRLAPVCTAMFVVAAVCVPSYLRFEPHAAAEGVGTLCLILASLAIAMFARPAVRATRAVIQTRRWLGECGNTIAIFGLIRPRLIVSEAAIRGLSPVELDAAVRHERAHAASFDNLKLLLMLLAPDPPVSARFQEVERAWRKFSEWAADDRAVDGDPEQSVALASALVRVARMGASPPNAPLVTSFVDGDLTARVERLLDGRTDGAPDCWTPAVFGLGLVALTWITLLHGALAAAYELLERLIR